MKRFRHREAKPGELIAYYGKERHDTRLDVMFSWGGSGASSSDANLLQSVLCGRRFGFDFEGGTTEEPSLVNELESRGYDITTLRFSIQQKAVEESHA